MASSHTSLVFETLGGPHPRANAGKCGQMRTTHSPPSFLGLVCGAFFGPWLVRHSFPVCRSLGACRSGGGSLVIGNYFPTNADFPKMREYPGLSGIIRNYAVFASRLRAKTTAFPAQPARQPKMSDRTSFGQRTHPARRVRRPAEHFPRS